MKRWRVWAGVAATALVLAATLGYCARRQEQERHFYLPVSLQARKGGPMADYYVNNAVGCPGAGTLGNPWCDFSQINTLVAGDTLHIRGGAGAYQAYDEPEIDITVSGTAANPITIRPYGTEMVSMNSPAGSSIFDVHGDWIVIDGQSTGQFYLNKANRAGAYTIYIRPTASDCTVQYVDQANVRWSGRIMRIEGDRATVRYCRIHGIYNGPSSDCVGIGVDDGDDVVIEYCTIWGIHGDCIIVDDTAPTPQSTVIRYNTLYTTLGPCAENGVDMKVGGTSTNYAEIHDNTLYGFRSCTGTCGGSGNPRGEAIGVRNSADYVLVYNNDISDSSTGIVLDDNVAHIIMRRNVIHDMATEAEDTNADSLSAIWVWAQDADIYHNTIDNAPENSFYIYGASDVVIENNIINDSGGVTGAALTGYSADYNLWNGCTETLPGPHDVTGQDPRFVSAAGDDYHLRDDSPAIDRGKDLGLSYIGAAPDLGAYEWEAEPADDPLIPPSPAPPAAVSGGGVAEYQVWLKDWNGQRIAVFTGTGRETGGLLSFSFLKLLRKPGQYVLRIDGTDERVALFALDFQVEFWRRDRFADLDWYKVFEAFHRADGKQFVESGQRIYESRGDHYNILLLAEPIFYPAGSSYATKSGPAETVAKAYVNENIGPAATSPPRDYDGVMPGLTIEADGATGATWEGGRAKRNLLDVLIELADYAPADFMVEGTGAAAFEFRWQPEQWGDDKTWGNAGGLPAVVFDAQFNNLRNLSYDYDRRNEINICHVLGQGAGEDRRVVTRTSGAEDDSPWNARAVCRDARNTYETEALNRKGDEVLDKMRSKVQTTVDVKQSEATRFGRDWDIGDIVTARDVPFGFEVSQKIVGVRVDLAQDGNESIQAMMEDP